MRIIFAKRDETFNEPKGEAAEPPITRTIGEKKKLKVDPYVKDFFPIF
jgi:hypothetical protein